MKTKIKKKKKSVKVMSRYAMLRLLNREGITKGTMNYDGRTVT